MVSIVLVSHSRALAEALVSLLRQVCRAPVRVALAAGVGAERQDFGTDALEIAYAIQSVDSPDGVLVLMDLGSAVLSAELAVDLLPEGMQARVRCCPGPLVEGALSAAVQAGLGSDLETVCQEARKALAPKVQQLEPGLITQVPAGPGLSRKSEAGFQEASVELLNAHGLHARPAARFVQLAGSFNAQVQVSNLSTGKGPVSALSLNSLAALGALKGHRISIRASGPEATAALNALTHLVQEGFAGGEAEAQEPRPVPAPDETGVAGEAIQGIAIAPGIAVGPLAIYQPVLPKISRASSRDPEAEWASLGRARQVVRRSIEDRQSRARASLGAARAAIFEAHRLILDDPAILDLAREAIFSAGSSAAAAWDAAVEQAAQSYQALEDPYLRARVADLRDVGGQVLRALLGSDPAGIAVLPGPAVLFAPELSPSEVAALEGLQVLGIVTAAGGPASHSAILARALGIPAVSGVDLPRLGPPAGGPVGLDGGTGRVWLQPDAALQDDLAARQKAWLAGRKDLLEQASSPARTRDGRRIEVAANVGSLATARAAAANGAEGIGVLRTEFLYLDRESPPSEAEQVEALIEIGRLLNGLPVIVRTLDVGGDKDLRYIDRREEANPYLGVRGLRLSLRQPELFTTQLRAILRAAHQTPLRVMFPMVTGVEEVQRAKDLLEASHRSLEEDGLEHAWPVPAGVMIEVPSAALLSGRLAPQVDFLSVGTNDLTQYTLAAERGNADLADFADALHPAVLNLVARVVAAAHRHGKWAGVCGEVAGDPAATALLAGLGVDELSMNPAEIPSVKRAIREVDCEAAVRLAEKALGCESAAQVRSLASGAAESG